MILSEYTMRRETASTKTSVRREIFEHGGRVLGTETTSESHFEGEWHGWVGTERTTDTRHFPTRAEAIQWINDLHEYDHVEAVRASGGTKLVVIL